jgi:AraC family transcriptional regulator, ethanolamine operon transcriptional activator
MQGALSPGSSRHEVTKWGGIWKQLLTLSRTLIVLYRAVSGGEDGNVARFVDDIDALNDGDPRLAFTYSQLGDGAITTTSGAIRVADSSISRYTSNRSYGFRGRVGLGALHVHIWTHHTGKISCSGAVADANQILLVGGGATADVTVLGESRSLAFTIDAKSFCSRLTEAASKSLANQLHDWPFIDCDEETLTALCADVREALATGGETNRPHRHVLERLTGLMNRAEIRPLSPSKHYAASIVHKALEYMSAHLSEPITLQDLCYACSWSKRSMIHYFSEALGITPMAYFKLQRLNAVRRALKTSDPRTTRVLDIAANFGFYHMGHFAADYQALFGIMPSRALIRAEPYSSIKTEYKADHSRLSDSMARLDESAL